MRGSSPRSFENDFAATLPETTTDSDERGPRRRRSGYRLRLSGRPLQLPKSTWGRVLSALAFLLFLGVCTAVLLAVRSFFLHDPRFTVPSSSFIESTGNTHVSRAQLLSVFGEDVERNIFRIPIAQRRAELESLPWVEHATVMRLLPNHIRISIVERTPVAFVREGSQIGMVDASGVLLDMPPDAAGDPNYSFPVVTGIHASDPLSTRAARMKIFAAFTYDLDSTGNRVSEKLSEVDLSNPEDVKALIPEGNNGISTDILVHFGDTDFLARYMRFQSHLREWLADHPKLASVDMRYQRQVVLEMQPGAPTTPAAPAPPPAPAPASVPAKPATAAALSAAKAQARPAPKTVASAAKRPAPKPVAKPVQTAKPAPATKAAPAGSETWHMVVVKPHTKAAAALAAKAKTKSATPPHSQAVPQ